MQKKRIFQAINATKKTHLFPHVNVAFSDDGVVIDERTLGASYTNEGKQVRAWCESVVD